MQGLGRRNINAPDHARPKDLGLRDAPLAGGHRRVLRADGRQPLAQAVLVDAALPQQRTVLIASQVAGSPSESAAGLDSLVKGQILVAAHRAAVREGLEWPDLRGGPNGTLQLCGEALSGIQTHDELNVR